MSESHTLSRWRRSAAVLAATVLIGVTAACSNDDSSSGDGEDAAVQFNWIMNSTWAGSYLADENGHYEDAGLNVELLTGGPNVDFMSSLSSGQALIAFAGFTEPATLNQEGSDFVLIGSLYQMSPLSVISQADDGITEPSDLEGRRMGVSDTAMSVWEQFSETAGIDTDQVELVPITTGPEALVAGDVDAYMGFITEGPGLLASMGVDAEAFLLQDFGYGYYVNAYTVRREDLEDEESRELIKDLLKADLQGQLDMIEDPEAAAELTVDRYGDELGLELESERSTVDMAIELFYSPTTEEYGIGYMAGEEMEIAMTTLNDILGTDMPTDGSGYVDMSLLDEILAEDPEFGQLPPRS